MCRIRICRNLLVPVLARTCGGLQQGEDASPHGLRFPGFQQAFANDVLEVFGKGQVFVFPEYPDQPRIAARQGNRTQHGGFVTGQCDPAFRPRLVVRNIWQLRHGFCRQHFGEPRGGIGVDGLQSLTKLRWKCRLVAAFRRHHHQVFQRGRCHQPLHGIGG